MTKTFISLDKFSILIMFMNHNNIIMDFIV